MLLEDLHRQLTELGAETLVPEPGSLTIITAQGAGNADPSMFALAQQTYSLLMKQSIEKKDFVTQLQNLLRKQLSSSLTLRDTARQLGMSVRTIQRRLKSKQLSFSQLVEQTRQSQALALLADTSMSLTAIASQMGYENTANFHRAFRRWYSLSPSEYRQLCQSNRTLLSEQPIRLHYAQTRLESAGELESFSGKVWLEVDNLGFEKMVSVECKGVDGIWRHVPAFFERFISQGTELWSTGSFPVARPLTFRLCYQVDGKKYINSNQDCNYVVQDGILLGNPDFVVLTLKQIRHARQYFCMIELATRHMESDRACCVFDDGSRHSLEMGELCGSYRVWTLLAVVDRVMNYCQFHFEPSHQPVNRSQLFPIEKPQGHRLCRRLQPEAITEPKC